MTTLKNAAVFLRGTRKYKGVDVELTPARTAENPDAVTQKVLVKNIKTGALMDEFAVLEVVKQDMAFDVESDDGPIRLVTQVGCGCSGQKPYEADAGYSGRLKF